MRQIILDTETTGLNPKQGHKIIEICCIEIINLKKTGNIFQKYINPNKEIDEGAYKIHGISNKFLEDKPEFKEIYKDFLNFISDSELIIHNAPFDIGFINNELELISINKINNKIIDTLQIARSKFPRSPVNLDALCKRFNIDNSKREKHSAIIDCELLLNIYIELIGGKQPKLKLKYNEKENDKKIINKKIKIINRSFKVNDDELSKHKLLLKNKIKNNIW